MNIILLNQLLTKKRNDCSEYARGFKDFYKTGVIKSKIYQGGLGDYVLCEDCNNFWGVTYVRDYVRFAKICMSALSQKKDFKAILLTLKRTKFKNYNFMSIEKIELRLNKYPSHTPIALDFRSKSELDRIL